MRTQKEDANIIGIDYPSYNKAVRGHRRIPIKYAELTSKITGIPLQDILYKDMNALSLDFESLYRN